MPYEQAVMAVRVSPEIVAVQFHPEADAEGMASHFAGPERRSQVVEDHGEAKYQEIVHRLENPDFIHRTHQTIIPGFLRTILEARVAV